MCKTSEYTAQSSTYRVLSLCCLQALYQPQGGILASELCIAAHLQAAQSYGADFHSGEKVKSWKVDPSSGIVTVFTDKEQYTAGKLVLTAGAWMPDIMPELQVSFQLHVWNSQTGSRLTCFG